MKKLKGLPLAAKAVGCLLYSKVDEEHWMNILKSQIWDLPPDKNNILPALRLSYKHLPPHLKQCFAFCSVFHKDHEYRKESLVQIWMALGFIQTRGKERMEDVGNSYFDDLVSRSFFQFHKGKYVMNYTIHGLAQSFSLDDCLRLEDLARNNNIARVKHLSFSCDNSKHTSFESFYKFRGIRTLLLLHGYKSPTSPLPNGLLYKLKYLRVLTLHRRDISELPDSIGNLKHLRFLDLSGTGIRKLPASISKLYNLQTLKLRNCELLDEIENGVTRLVNLRHLEAHTRLVTPIPNIGSLTCLQQLEEFVIRKDKGYKISELKNMSDLRGHLCIRNLEHVSCKDEATDAMLSGKEYLTGLDLVWSDETHSRTDAEHLHDHVLEVLQPHSGLKELKIKGFAGAKFPTWLVTLRYLHTINLFDCERCESFPPLGQLPLLKNLEIGGLHAVARIGREFSGNGGVKGFPSLKELVLADMPNLREWICEDEGEFFPRLTDLEVQNCLALRELPHLPPTLKRLRISEAGLHVLPNVRVSDSLPSSSLSSLYIDFCPNLESLEGGLLMQQLRVIKNLTIGNCEKLACLPVEGFGTLASLRRLHIYNCPRLKQFERTGSLLPCLLKELQIRSCSKLINSILLELHDLSSIANLTIADCDDLYQFPEEGLSAMIKFLSISNCKNLQNIPARLKELSFLKTFTIFNCPQVPCLPTEGLPERLQELYIKDCPLLTDRCQVNIGADWPKIAHIPNIDVDEEGIVPERSIYRRR